MQLFLDYGLQTLHWEDKRPYVANNGISKQPDSDLRTGLGIRKCVMMVHKFISAGGCNGLELVAREAAAEMPAGSCQSVEELVLGIVHLIDPEHRLEAALIEAGVVRNERQSLDERLDLFPDIWKDRGIFGVFRTQSVHASAEPLVVFRLGVYETVE